MFGDRKEGRVVRGMLPRNKGKKLIIFLGVQEAWAGPCPHGKRFARWKMVPVS
jgi:hypothetical protein